VTRPGVDINLIETSPPLVANADISAMFASAGTERGPTVPTKVTTFAQWKKFFGGRVSQSMGYDCLEASFRSGVANCWFCRLVGPASVLATKSLLNTATQSLRADANGAGTWGNSITISVAAGVVNAAARVITVTLITTDGTGTITEVSPEAVDNATLINWAANTQLIRLTQGVNTGLPDVVAPANLTTGADDIANENDAAFQTAIDKFTLDLGPGQVVACGRTTTAAIATIANHAQAMRRVALGDLADTSSASTLTTAAATHRLLASSRWLALFAPWAVIPGTSGDTQRKVPYSAIQAGLIAQADRFVAPATPAAGRQYGSSFYAVGLSQSYTAAERSTLSTAGVNIARVIQGVVETYDYVSAASPTLLPAWKSFGSARTAMLILAQCADIGEIFFGSILDGKGHTLHAFGGAIEGVLKALWDKDALYGNETSDAYRVDVDSVNNPTTAALLELHALVAFRTSPFAQYVVIDVVNVPVTQGV
jgi:hypothetical protein